MMICRILVTHRMDSHQLARYIEETDGISKPWLLVQLRLAKLQENKNSLTPEAYAYALADIHQDLMNLGQWWKGQETQVFTP
jgi:Ni,Fe-hydrogenase maturation factor